MKWAALALLAAACSAVNLRAPELRVREGPAVGAKLRRVALLPTACATVQCGGISAILAEAFEFAGYQVIDPESLSAQPRTREETGVDEASADRYGSSQRGTRTVEVEGARVSDLDIFSLRAVLGSLSVDGVVGARVEIGPGHGLSQRRTVDALVRLLRFSDSELVWARRCSLEVDLTTLDERAIETAIKCALAGMPGP